MQNLIEIKNLEHVYTDTDGNEVKALDGVSLIPIRTATKSKRWTA